MSRFRALALTCLAVLLAGLVAVWLLRFRAAGALVERRLAAAGVPASYRLTKIGPFVERIEDLRIGDPRAPDLVAGAIEVSLAYGASGPVVRAIRAEHVVARARLARAGLSLGYLDRLLPRSGQGGAALPDLALDLRDTHLALDTPNGMITAVLEGLGNPQRRFAGHTKVSATALSVATCKLSGVNAAFSVSVREGRPSATGPVALTRVACPKMALGSGHAQVVLASDAALRRLSATAALAGFPGSAGPIRFASVGGRARAAGQIGAIDLTAGLAFVSASVPAAANWPRATRLGLDGTPAGPTVARAHAAITRLLADADADVALTASIRGQAATAAVQRVALNGRDGARIIAVSTKDDTALGADGLRMEARIDAGGGALPTFQAHLRGSSSGARLVGLARLGTYRAGDASLEVPALRFGWVADRATFDGVVRVSGPIGDGAVRGLEVPLRGEVGRDGALVMGQGCEVVRFDALWLGSLRFGGSRARLCGRPLVSRTERSGMRIDAALGPLALAGHTGSGTPITLDIASARLSERGFSVQMLRAELGDNSAPTHLAVAELSGALAGQTAAGWFAGATAAIGSVPLSFMDAAGRWTFGGGSVALHGALRLGDRAAAPRFRILVAPDATLVLKDSLVRATATLREPASGVEVAKVDLAQDLTHGSGRALLAVDDLRFAPKGLQPEALTPLTLGVIANVSGRIEGQGRIDWDARGVRSIGDFGTDGLDLAAAFGPVSGVKGRIAFTDLLNLVSAPHQQATVAVINPGVAITDGVVRFNLPGESRVAVEDAHWPFAGGTMRLAPTTLDFGAEAERHLTFRVDAMDAAAFVQQLDFPNLAATGTFDGALPMIFGPAGGRIVGGTIVARAPGGTLAYVGELSSARLGTMGKLAFDALKAIRYSTLAIDLDGQLDGEMVSRVGFTGVREATPDPSLLARMIRNLPFRFNINIRAPFRGLVGTARSYMEPQLLLDQVTAPQASAIQPPASGGVR